MSQNTLDFEIIGLPHRDGYDLKITSVIGTDSVKINHKIGRAVVSASKQTEKVVILYELIPQNPTPALQKSPQKDIKDGKKNHDEGSTSAGFESSTMIITIEKEGKDLILHTRESSSGEDGSNPVDVRIMDIEASDRAAGIYDCPLRHLTSHDEHGMRLIVGYGSPYECSGCRESGIGDRYVCDEESCPYILHPDCRYHEEQATHDFLNGSTFKFLEGQCNQDHSSCVACGRDIIGYFYHCDVTNKHLHPCCLNLKKTIHVGVMKFMLCEKLISPCFYCNSKKKGSMDNCWCYSSEKHDLQAHVSCMMDVLQNSLKGKSNNNKKLTMLFLKLKIFELIERAKMLINKITEFLKSSTTHLKKATKFLKSAKKQLEKIITFLELLKKPLKKMNQTLGSANIHLKKIDETLDAIIMVVDGLLEVFSAFSAPSDDCKVGL